MSHIVRIACWHTGKLPDACVECTTAFRTALDCYLQALQFFHVQYPRQVFTRCSVKASHHADLPQRCVSTITNLPKSCHGQGPSWLRVYCATLDAPTRSDAPALTVTHHAMVDLLALRQSYLCRAWTLRTVSWKNSSYSPTGAEHSTAGVIGRCTGCSQKTLCQYD